MPVRERAIGRRPSGNHSIKRNCLDPLGLSVTEAAKVLGVARHTLSRVLNGRAAVSPAMAIRLEKAGWSNAEFWLRRQTTYDLARARKGEHRIKIKPYPTLVTPQEASSTSQVRESPPTSKPSNLNEGET